MMICQSSQNLGIVAVQLKVQSIKTQISIPPELCLFTTKTYSSIKIYNETSTCDTHVLHMVPCIIKIINHQILHNLQ